MLKYTIRRLVESLITVLIIVTIVFLLLRLLPTDYYFTEEQLMKFTEEQKQEQLLAAGLLDPIPEQLMNFYNDVIHLDFAAGLDRDCNFGCNRCSTGYSSDKF